MTSPAATGSLLGSPTSSRFRPGVGDHSGLGTSAPSGPPGDSLPSGRSQPPGSPPSTQMVSIPHIPTFCTPERPRPPPGASEASQLDLHARGLTDSDQELLESPRAVPSSLPAPGQASATVSAPPPAATQPVVPPDMAALQARLDWLEARVAAQAPSRPPPPVSRPSCSQAGPSRRWGSPEPNRTVSLDPARARPRSRSPPPPSGQSRSRAGPSRRWGSPEPDRTVTLAPARPRHRSRSPLQRAPASPRRPPFRRGRSPVRSVQRSPARSSSRESRGSVFSRLGSRASHRSPSRSPDRPENPDVSWSALIDMAMVLAGETAPPPPPPTSSTGLLDRPTAPPSRTSFPPSSGVTKALESAFEQFTGGHRLDDVPPGQLPSEVLVRPPVGRFGKGFKPEYHGGDAFPIPVKSLAPSADETSFLRPNADPSVPIKKVGDVEYLLRKNVRVLSTLDWLLQALREVSSLPHQDAAVMDALWTHIRKTLSYSTEFSAGALMSTIVLRREAFLRGCDTTKVPRRTHTWATLRPPFSSSTALLGDASTSLRTSAREDKEMALMTSLSSRKPPASRDSHRPQGPAAAASRSTARPAQQSRQQPSHSARSAPASAPRGRRTNQSFRPGDKTNKKQ